MLGCYRRDDFQEPEIFAGHVRRVLAKYPLWVIKQAACRVPETYVFVPSIAEISKTCDEIFAPYLREQRRQSVRSETLAHRALPRPPRQGSYEKTCEDMAAKGMPLRERDRSASAFDVSKFCRENGIDEAVLNGLPDGPPPPGKKLG